MCPAPLTGNQNSEADRKVRLFFVSDASCSTLPLHVRGTTWFHDVPQRPLRKTQTNLSENH